MFYQYKKYIFANLTVNLKSDNKYEFEDIL
nr:MAG TPA: hypothetical protein [Caudoviricetes sp.]